MAVTDPATKERVVEADTTSTRDIELPGAGASSPGTPRDPRTRWWPSRQGVMARGIALAMIAGLILGSPLLIADVSVNVVSKAAVFGIIALSMNILMGYTGQVSLGHNAFVGVGAFSAGIVVSQLAMPWAFGLIVAVLIGAATALTLGAIALRIKGFYLALVTITYGLFAEKVIFNIRAVTNGGAGMPAPRPAWALSDVTYAYLAIGALALVLLFDWRLTSSKAGRAIRALRDDERVAASWGINVTGYKLLAFVLSGSVAGLAGGLMASITQMVSPISFSFSTALTFVLMTVVGGLGSRPGVVIGGIVFATLSNILEAAHSSIAWWPFGSRWEPLLGASLLLVTLIKFPGGIAQQFEAPLRWLSFRPFRGDRPASVGGGAGGGQQGARP